MTDEQPNLFKLRRQGRKAFLLARLGWELNARNGRTFDLLGPKYRRQMEERAGVPESSPEVWAMAAGILGAMVEEDDALEVSAFGAAPSADRGESVVA